MMPPVEPFDPFKPILRADPYPEYRRYLAAGSVHRGRPTMPELPESWYVFGYPEARAVLTSPAFIHQRAAVTAGAPGMGVTAGHADLWDFLGRWFLLQDPPPHTAQRARVARPFRPDEVQRLAAVIERTAAGLLDEALGRGGFELMGDYAYPLSLRVIVHVLGIPRPDLRWFKSCTRSLAAALSIRAATDSYAEAAVAVAELTAFLRDAVAAADFDPTGLVGALRQPPEGGAVLAEDDLLALLSFLLFAGQETVSDALGSGVHTLARYPLERARLVADPGLLATAVEEILRFEPPVQYAVTRTATTDVAIGEVVARRGDPVTVVIGAASRDPRRYANPDQFDVGRTGSGDSLVFGKGIHVCLGIHLARLTLRIALGELLARLPAQWQCGAPVWRDNISLRGPASLVLTF